MPKKLEISKRGELAPASPIRKLVPLADEAKKKGIKVYHLNIGQPDFHVSPKIENGIKKVKNLNYLPYEKSQGNNELLCDWEKYYKEIKVDIKKENIIITSGASEALVLTTGAICDPGDEFIVFEPFYTNYSGFANLVSAKVVAVGLDDQNGYHLPKKEEIEAKISKRTKAIFFTNPNNPTGTVFTRSEIQLILDIAKKHNLFVVSDESYHGIAFDEKKSLSIYHVANKLDRERIILIDSISKRLNACGTRIGIVASENQNFISSINRFAQARLSVSTIDQIMVSSAISGNKSYIEKLTKEYQKRRDVFIGTLEKELDIKIHLPEGAFYTMIKLPIKDSDDFAKWLLTDFDHNHETVMVAPGSGFYITNGMGNDEIRVAYVLSQNDLKQAAKILAIAVKEYIKKELLNKFEVKEKQ